jgi:hypothetical protein
VVGGRSVVCHEKKWECQPMNINPEIAQKARLLPRDQRKSIITSFKEVELHRHLKELFKTMEPEYEIEITHKAGEKGKDLVMVKKDKLMTDVMGVIVKVGAIRAKTLGDVDALKARIKGAYSLISKEKSREIESQIEQAFAHKAEMKAIFAKLPVTKVFVVLAGELSGEARDRLSSEIKESVEIKDLDWLVDYFTEYYPQVFFEGRIVDFIHEKIEELEKKHWLVKRNLNLSDYFVEPLVSSIEVPVKFDEQCLELVFKDRKLPFSQLKSMIGANKKSVLVGDAGVGKSVALTKLTIDMLRTASDQLFRDAGKKRKVSVPVLITAKQLSETNKLEDLLISYFKSQEAVDKFNCNILIVDALDEVPFAQVEVIRRAEEYAKRLDCSLIITGRKVEALRTPPSGFEKYELLPFEHTQAVRVFEKLVRNADILASLKDGLDKIQFQLPMIPLSLVLLVEIAEERKEIPASVTELYDMFYELLLGRWDRDKGIAVLFDYTRKRRFLAELAFNKFFKGNQLELSNSEFKEFCKDFALKYDLESNELDTFIKEIDRACIIDINETVQFCHRSFLDYFVARYIFDQRAELPGLEDSVVNIYFDDTWTNVAFFYVGLLKEISSGILEKILSYQSDEIGMVMNKFLVGKLLQAGWNSPKKIKETGIERALDFAPLLRSGFLEIINKSAKNRMPIYADFFLLVLSDLSFGSAFLLKQIETLFKKDLLDASVNYLYEMMLLLWAIRRFLKPEELKTEISKYKATFSKRIDVAPEDKIRAYLILTIIAKADKPMMKLMRRKLNKLMGKYPNLFRKLLPAPKKGFRRK